MIKSAEKGQDISCPYAMGDFELKRRREAGGFAFPIADEGCGHDQQRGLSVGRFVLFAEEGGEHLHGFAEAHIVGEAGAESGACAKPEPIESDFLIGAQFGV